MHSLYSPVICGVLTTILVLGIYGLVELQWVLKMCEGLDWIRLAQDMV